MKPTDYFARNPVFRFVDFASAHQEDGKLSPQASHAVLKQHVKAGNLLHIKRGLYAVVPRGESPDTTLVDPYLLASRLAPDGVVAYHAALQLHGKAYSIFRRFTYLTAYKVAPFEYRGSEFIPVLVPSRVRKLAEWGGAMMEKHRQGLGVRVTTLERTMVDVLDSPRHGGGWEEIWRSLESVEFFKLDALIEYALALGSAVTVARVGFFLEQHRETLMVEEHHLKMLEKHAPSRPVYLDHSYRKQGKLFPRWNLLVPEKVVNRAWEETP